MKIVKISNILDAFEFSKYVELEYHQIDYSYIDRLLTFLCTGYKLDFNDLSSQFRRTQMIRTRFFKMYLTQTNNLKLIDLMTSTSVPTGSILTFESQYDMSGLEVQRLKIIDPKRFAKNYRRIALLVS